MLSVIKKTFLLIQLLVLALSLPAKIILKNGQYYDTVSKMWWDQGYRIWINRKNRQIYNPRKKIWGILNKNGRPFYPSENLSKQKLPDIPGVTNTLNKIAQKYNIHFYIRQFPKPGGEITIQELTNQDNNRLRSYIHIFNQEWNKYSIDFVKKVGLKAIVLAKNMTVSGQARTGVPSKHILYLDIYAKPDYYTRHVIHHEFYHIIEFNFQGDYYYKDPKWMAFNAPGIKYGKGGLYMRDPKIAWKMHPEIGFVTGYSTSAVEEDKAELFAFLMNKKHYIILTKWMKSDKVLRKKVKYMKFFLRSKSSAFDRNYFHRIHGL